MENTQLMSKEKIYSSKEENWKFPILLKSLLEIVAIEFEFVAGRRWWYLCSLLRNLPLFSSQHQWQLK